MSTIKLWQNERESTVGGARCAELFVEAITSFCEGWETVWCWEIAQSHLGRNLISTTHSSPVRL